MGSERRVRHRCHEQQPRPPLPPCPRAAVRGGGPASAGGRHTGDRARSSSEKRPAVVRAARRGCGGGTFLASTDRPSPTADILEVPGCFPLRGFDNGLRASRRCCRRRERTRAVCVEKDIASADRGQPAFAGTPHRVTQAPPAAESYEGRTAPAARSPSPSAAGSRTGSSRYPAPRTVTISKPSLPKRPSFSRSQRMWTSTVLRSPR
jgi:hypothetical protein